MAKTFFTTSGSDARTFQALIARDLIRLAAGQEGLETWLASHGGSVAWTGGATRRIAAALYGDTEDAALFNAHLTLALDRRLRMF